MTNLNILQDRAVRRYYLFLLLSSILFLGAVILLCVSQTNAAKNMLLSNDETIVSSLLKQGVSENVIAKALTASGTERSQEGAALLGRLGIRPALDTQFLPHLCHFQKCALRTAIAVSLPICLLLLGVSFFFLYHREKLYHGASLVIDNYINGCYTRRLPQTSEGTVYRMFSLVDQLAAMLRAQNETAQKSKTFLRDTISDISHQLRTPLAALSMYQEIMENEYDTPAVVQNFAAKTGLALRRMEQLIQSMLKLTRLDAGNVIFEKKICTMSKIVSDAVSDLTTRAASEGKKILLSGTDTDLLSCDAAWTREAISNIVKNALDHMPAGGVVQITWEVTPFAGMIRIADNGEGIAQEDIHHIFKRFYRSHPSQDTPGIGLGLPLAKSIIEGQGGTISLQSTLHVGTTFTLMLPSS